MVYTRHGHWIGPGEPVLPRPPMAKCGGPHLCAECAVEVTEAFTSWVYRRSRTLAEVLAEIEQHDTDYDARYPLVWQALALALAAGHAAGVRIDAAEPEWPVVYIELPTGQVSWHMPQHPVPWDEHDTDEKYRRVRAFVAGGN